MFLNLIGRKVYISNIKLTRINQINLGGETKMVSIDALSLLIGVVYGYMSPGKEDKMKILKKGLRWGLIIGIVLALLNFVLGGGILYAGATIIGTVIAIVYLTVMFVVGTFIGDFLEGMIKK
jgi:hypothetical protein